MLKNEINKLLWRLLTIPYQPLSWHLHSINCPSSFCSYNYYWTDTILMFFITPVISAITEFYAFDVVADFEVV